MCRAYFLESAMRLHTLLLTALGGAAAFAAGRPDDLVVKSTSNLVVLDVSVLGADGSPIAGLSRDNFQIVEDGKRQVIKQFSKEDAAVSIGFVVDMSGSMHSKVESVKRATSAFLDASNPRDEYFLIAFNDRPWLGLPAGMEFSTAREDIRRAFLTVHSAGRTALYDAVALGVQHVAKGRHERRVLILISDGKDTASLLTRLDALQYVRSSPVTIYTIGLFSPDDEDSNRGVLRQLARVTGGRYYEPATNAAIDQACVTIARDIRARYTMAYTPPAEAKSTVRKIKVELARSSGGGAKGSVRARSEYVLKPN